MFKIYGFEPYVNPLQGIFISDTDIWTNGFMQFHSFEEVYENCKDGNISCFYRLMHDAFKIQIMAAIEKVNRRYNPNKKRLKWDFSPSCE